MLYAVSPRLNVLVDTETYPLVLQCVHLVAQFSSCVCSFCGTCFIDRDIKLTGEAGSWCEVESMVVVVVLTESPGQAFSQALQDLPKQSVSSDQASRTGLTLQTHTLQTHSLLFLSAWSGWCWVKSACVVHVPLPPNTHTQTHTDSYWPGSVKAE